VLENSGKPIPFTGLPTGFFAYASAPPGISVTISAAIQGINRTNQAAIQSWEQLKVNGKWIISEICEAIQQCEFFCADVSGVNPNVMFEIGYAIAANKRIWLVRDDSYIESKKEFEQLRLLTTIGFSRYLNSEQIIKSFFAEQPHLSQDETVFKQSIEGLLSPTVGRSSILYLKSKYDTNASVAVTRALEDSGLELVINDPNETSIQPLYWYAQKLWQASGLVTHFLSPDREGFKLHNARYALISGLATGLGRKTLMLSEHSQVLAPMDYRDWMRTYTRDTEAGEIVQEWLLPLASEKAGTGGDATRYQRALRLATELKDFHVQLGDYVAENESTRLEEYFVETTASADLINGTQNMFVGRKGTGKTANLLHAEALGSKDPRNLVCIVKPVGYEIEGLVRLFGHYKIQDQKGYVIESLWKFMLYTEIARAASQQITQKALWELTDPDAKELIDLLEDETQSFSGDFIIRLEKVVKSLEVLPTVDTDEHFRRGISEALHSGAIARLRSVLGRVLNKKRHVLLLIDNLDKPWTKNADLAQLAEFILGLLTATNRIGEELNRGHKMSAPTKFNSAIFLRSDIFERVSAAAREPDKLAYSRIRWSDPELLLRIIEERYVASHGPDSDPSLLWRKYFCALTRGIATRDYLASRILKRPRDIVFLVKAAVSFAVNRGHDKVEERDILDGEKQYSQYALDSILVENGITVPQLESVLFEFVGAAPIVSEPTAKELIAKAISSKDKIDGVLDHLVRLSFLGVETTEGVFSYSDEPREFTKNRVLSDHLVLNKGMERRYQINAPFRSYLEVDS
jgi:hypothetical protein